MKDFFQEEYEEDKVTIIYHSWMLNSFQSIKARLYKICTHGDIARNRNNISYMIKPFGKRKKKVIYSSSCGLIVKGYHDLSFGCDSSNDFADSLAEVDEWVAKSKPTIIYDMRNFEKLKETHYIINNGESKQ